MKQYPLRLLVLLGVFFLSAVLQLRADEKISPHPGKTICLNMIVKNETHVIKRSLGSVKPFIDYWVIVDTGSTDGTQEMIKEFMKDIPGELHEKPWVNFGHNREEALQLAKNKADYIFFIDADDYIKFDDDFKWPELTLDSYYVKTIAGGWEWNNNTLIKTSKDWHWHGVLHEYVNAKDAVTSDVIPGIYNIFTHQGARSKDPQKYIRDAQVLEEGLKKEPNNQRYAFYLAQSYYSAHDLPKALEAYKKRVSMGGWDQEIFWSMLQIAKIQDELEYDPKVVEAAYGQAFKYRSTRAEPLYYLISNYRKDENYARGYEIGHVAINMRVPSDILFVEKWIYDYGMLFEFSVCAYWTGHYDESLKACDTLLANPNLPATYREYALRNRGYALEKVRQASIQKSLANLLPPDSSAESSSKTDLNEAAVSDASSTNPEK
jgi:glycosyltransferase involved in cell wall biosynthesis